MIFLGEIKQCLFILSVAQLLIGYESGQLALWDLKLKQAELRWHSTERLKSAGWHNDGKQFMCSHVDGSLTTWAVRPGTKPVNVLLPHGEGSERGYYRKPEVIVFIG